MDENILAEQCNQSPSCRKSTTKIEKTKQNVKGIYIYIYIANKHAAKMLNAFFTYFAVKGFYMYLIKRFAVYTRIPITLKNNNDTADK